MTEEKVKESQDLLNKIQQLEKHIGVIETRDLKNRGVRLGVPSADRTSEIHETYKHVDCFPMNMGDFQEVYILKCKQKLEHLKKQFEQL